MKLKVGDKLLCKEEVRLFYKILKIDEDKLLLQGPYKKVLQETIWFRLCNKPKSDLPYLWNFFYSDKELRKDKLKKLNLNSI